MNKKRVIIYIVDWLKAYVENSGVNGFVIGISGGVDSALTSTLAAETGLSLLVVEMPIHQDAGQVNRAKSHADWLVSNYTNVSRQQVDLTSTFDHMVDEFPSIEDEETRWMALANTRARLRMTTLYYFAGLHKMLVLGTGNKVEDFGIGFFTKYGDGGVDLSPIGDLLKSEVYALAQELNINSDIINAAPTDGLWGDERNDEDQIGATYPELEWAMNFTGDSASLTEREKEVLKIYQDRYKANLHKMIEIPVCKISNEVKEI
ncbi:MAG: NAD(+) synthase [Crocinitomicaceae bacterium]|nr:NAD(+) synthase [Crocinitomicaceae bacterium]|tara:strand:- start:107 stop:892 length:786 start_codon:yes stop_codon:yes gene_type:complete